MRAHVRMHTHARKVVTFTQEIMDLFAGNFFIRYSRGTTLTWTTLRVTGCAIAAGTGTVGAAIGGGRVVTAPRT